MRCALKTGKKFKVENDEQNFCSCLRRRFSNGEFHCRFFESANPFANSHETELKLMGNRGSALPPSYLYFYLSKRMNCSITASISFSGTGFCT